MEKLIAMGKELELGGADLLKFISEQQASEREERAREGSWEGTGGGKESKTSTHLIKQMSSAPVLTQRFK